MAQFVKLGARLVNVDTVRAIDLLCDVPAGKTLRVHIEREADSVYVAGEDALALLQAIGAAPAQTAGDKRRPPA